MQIYCANCGVACSDFLEAGLHAKTNHWRVDVGLTEFHSLLLLMGTINAEEWDRELFETPFMAVN